MPKVSGVFESFKDLDLVPIEDINKWVDKLSLQPQIIENYLGNLILYPQMAPLKPEDLKLDLAILREAFKRNPGFYSPNQRKLSIPLGFAERFGDLKEVILAFLDGVKMSEITQVVVSGNGHEEVVGSVITPKFTKDNAEVELTIEEKFYKVKKGSLTVVPCPKSRCHIIFKATEATLISKKDITVESYGGSLGIVIDAR